MEITEFLAARWDEEQQLADAALREARGSHWYSSDDGVFELKMGLSLLGGAYGSLDSSLGDHIVRHDPARVLADLAAKRAMLALWQKIIDGWYSPDANQFAEELIGQLLAPYGKRAVWTKEAAWMVDG